MANLDFLIQVADYSLLVYCVVLAGVGLWAIQARVPNVVKAKYASRVTYMSQLPFAYQWRQAVGTEDLQVFERARVRNNVFLLVLSALILIISLYAYVNAVVMLHRCHMQGAGLL